MLREFWIEELQTSYRLVSEPLLGHEPIFKVREVSPALDAAYAECEKALDHIDDNLNGDDMYLDEGDVIHGSTIRQALAALRKARE